MTVKQIIENLKKDDSIYVFWTKKKIPQWFQKWFDSTFREYTQLNLSEYERTLILAWKAYQKKTNNEKKETK